MVNVNCEDIGEYGGAEEGKLTDVEDVGGAYEDGRVVIDIRDSVNRKLVTSVSLYSLQTRPDVDGDGEAGVVGAESLADDAEDEAGGSEDALLV